MLKKMQGTIKHAFVPRACPILLSGNDNSQGSSMWLEVLTAWPLFALAVALKEVVISAAPEKSKANAL